MIEDGIARLILKIRSLFEKEKLLLGSRLSEWKVAIIAAESSRSKDEIMGVSRGCREC